MGEQVIVLTDLTKQYGNFTAVDHIRLNIRKGEIFGLLGPNGAGKSCQFPLVLLSHFRFIPQWQFHTNAFF